MEIANVGKKCYNKSFAKILSQIFCSKKERIKLDQNNNLWPKIASRTHVESVIGQRTNISCLDLKLASQTNGLEEWQDMKIIEWFLTTRDHSWGQKF